MDKVKSANLILRAALAFVFLYAAIASFLAPYNWIGYFPVFLKQIFPQNILLTGFSVFELLLALWLISGKKTFFAAILAALALSGIIVFNLAQLDVIFRDVGLILSAIALAILSKE